MMNRTLKDNRTLQIAVKIVMEYEKTIASAYDRKRFEEMKRLIKNEYDKTTGDNPNRANDGILGCIIELYCRDSNSTLIKVRTQGKNDAYIPTASGKRVKAEIKSNGGQIQEFKLMPRKQQEKTFCIYFMDIITNPKGKNPKHRTLFKISTIAEFMDVVKEKPQGNKIYIQPSNNGMYNKMLQFEDFQRNKVYTI